MAQTSFMFHAIGDLVDGDWADVHYSYTFEKFQQFLKRVGRVDSLENLLAGSSDSEVYLTFDDGHISNYQAAKYLYENRLGRADFFVNPDLVGRAFYMSWEQLRELSEMGMSIQSHGLDHCYLSDCDDVELHRQLLESKRIIEKNIEQTVTILAPPGGRFDQRVEKIAKQVGYKMIANSVPGHVSSKPSYLCPRVAVMREHSVDTLLGYRSRFSRAMIQQKVKYWGLKLVKMILGNQRYEKLRWQLLGEQ